MTIMDVNDTNVDLGMSDFDIQIDSNLALFILHNGTSFTEPFPEPLPMYIRVTVCIFIVTILTVGTVGNTMIALVISCSRDMRTSTNFFLVNLSVADLLVLVLVTPTALLEVIYHPEIWMLGKTLCYLVPVLELTVCHASVLTILAISFERYYAICSPLQANYVCTKARAVYICIIVWILACIITSPVFFMTRYYDFPNPITGAVEPKCIVIAGSPWPDFYTVFSIVIFFLIPLVILIITYGIIAQRLTQDRSALNAKNENNRGRRQVVLMLGTVVFTFFLCLLPFRILTLAVLVTDVGSLFQTHTHAYYTILYLSRIMAYVNSALNPILYNIMSSKFRNGFLRLCGRRRKQFIFHRNGTFLTLTTTTSHTLSLTNNNFNNIIPQIQNSPSPSTSPDLMLNNSGGLSRKNGIRKHNQSRLNLPKQNLANAQAQVHRNAQKKNDPAKVLNPRTLSKKIIYSYVSGHKSESML